VVQAGGRVERRVAERELSPTPLVTSETDGTHRVDRSMVRAVINECLKVGLLHEDGDFLVVCSPLDQLVQNHLSMQSVLPRVITDLVMIPEGDSGDLATAVAWYLGQDALSPPGTWKEFGSALQQQGASELLRFNDNTFQMFEYWARYLGFAIRLAVPSAPTDPYRLAPDPTEALRRVLEGILGQGHEYHRLGPCMQRVGDACPVLEGGRIRKEVDRFSSKREPRALSSATSHALLRLADEGVLSLQTRSDADALILVDGDKTIPVSAIAWKGHSAERNDQAH